MKRSWQVILWETIFKQINLHAKFSIITGLNSTMRTINLTTYILAPIVVGFVADASHWGGAVFVAGWNVISGIVEYRLLRSIYNSLPELGAKDSELTSKSKSKTNSISTNSQNN